VPKTNTRKEAGTILGEKNNAAPDVKKRLAFGEWGKKRRKAALPEKAAVKGGG